MTADSTPLCVDLDGTLIRTDILHEMLAGALRDPATLARLPQFLARGKAGLKAALAERVAVDIDSLPFHEPLLAWLQGEHERGRRLVLVTAAPQRMANAVAEHVGMFDLVLASSASENLRGKAKAAELARRYGEHGFDYAGNDTTDLAVWKRCSAAILVDVSPSLRDKASHIARIEREFPRNESRWRAFARALRPFQWSKNILAFIPTFTSGAFGDLRGWMAALLVFAAFSASASAIYLVNDLTDLLADRRHPRKRSRPFASGALPLMWGFVGAPVLLAAGIAFGISAGVAWLIVTYAALAVMYSLRLKEWVLVDILTLTVLFVLRLYAGGEASGHHVSPWLLAFASCFFFSLATMKRVAELVRLSPDGNLAQLRTAYGTDDRAALIGIGCGAALVATLVLALYVHADFTTVADPLGLHAWAIVPLALFWQSRMWRASIRGDMLEDPIVFAARDWASWLSATLMLVVFTLALLRR